MDGVGRDGEHGAFGEEPAADGQAALREQAREPYPRRRVYAQRLVEDRLEVRKPLDLLVRRDRVVVARERRVELLLELALRVLVLCEVVGERA